MSERKIPKVLTESTCLVENSTIVPDDSVVQLIKEGETIEVKPPKQPRKPTAYNMFVKEHMKDFPDIPVKERMSKIGELWKKEKEKKAKAEAKKAKSKAKKTKKTKE